MNLDTVARVAEAYFDLRTLPYGEYTRKWPDDEALLNDAQDILADCEAIKYRKEE